MTFDLPRLKFVNETTIDDQFDHMLSEVDEITFELDATDTPNMHRVAEEIADLMQSCATALYIVERNHGISPLCAIENVKAKNKARGYEP